MTGKGETQFCVPYWARKLRGEALFIDIFQFLSKWLSVGLPPLSKVEMFKHDW